MIFPPRKRRRRKAGKAVSKKIIEKLQDRKRKGVVSILEQKITTTTTDLVSYHSIVSKGVRSRSLAYVSYQSTSVKQFIACPSRYRSLISFKIFLHSIQLYPLVRSFVRSFVHPIILVPSNFNNAETHHTPLHDPSLDTTPQRGLLSPSDQ